MLGPGSEATTKPSHKRDAPITKMADFLRGIKGACDGGVNYVDRKMAKDWSLRRGLSVPAWATEAALGLSAVKPLS